MTTTATVHHETAGLAHLTGVMCETLVRWLKRTDTVSYGVFATREGHQHTVRITADGTFWVDPTSVECRELHARY